MSETMAWRSEAQIHFEGADITNDISPYLISVTYTDNEEDDADDLQIKLEDCSGIWQNKKINAMIQAAVRGYKNKGQASGSSSSSTEYIGSYKVLAKSGLIVHSRPGEQYHVYGLLSYGKIVAVSSISGGWAKIDYDNKTAFISASNLKKVPTQSGTTSGPLKIQAVLHRECWSGQDSDEVLNCGEFDLDSVTSQGPPATVTIKATSLSYSNSIRQTKKTFAWVDYNLKSIAERIAENNGMGLMYLPKASPKYARQEQYKESDISFLKRMCHDEGFSLKVTNNVLVVFDQAEFEAHDAVRTIEKGDGYERYKLSTGDDDTYTSCCVSYTQSDGTVIAETAYVDGYNADDENNQCLKVSRKVVDKAEAKKLANELLRLHNKYAFEGSFTYPFDPSLCAGMRIDIGKTFGAFAGQYIIKRAVHKVGSSSTTQITLRHVL